MIADSRGGGREKGQGSRRGRNTEGVRQCTTKCPPLDTCSTSFDWVHSRPSLIDSVFTGNDWAQQAQPEKGFYFSYKNRLLF